MYILLREIKTAVWSAGSAGSSCGHVTHSGESAQEFLIELANTVREDGDVQLSHDGGTLQTKLCDLHISIFLSHPQHDAHLVCNGKVGICWCNVYAKT